MNERIEKLKQKAYVTKDGEFCFDGGKVEILDVNLLVKLIVEETLTQVTERSYYCGDRAWSNGVDRQWIQLEFGYGPLAEIKK